jgi:hypothetical protein
VSDKKNLTVTEVSVVADLLVSETAISDFLCHARSLHESWLPVSAQLPRDGGNNTEALVMAALDMVQELSKGNHICRVLLRFAYVQLAWAIDAYKAMATTDRI